MAAAAIGALDIGDLTEIPRVDLRNGNPANLPAMQVHPSVPDGYKWPLLGNVNAAIEAGDRLYNPMIRSCWALLQANRPAEANDAQVRKAAIVLGTNRAVNWTSWRFVAPAEFVARETHTPLYRWAAGAWVREVGSDDDLWNAAQEFQDLDDDERAGATIIASCGVCTPVLQGLSLERTGHHYLSDAGLHNQSRRAFSAVEKQFWVGAPWANFAGGDLVLIQDAMWHKSLHPVAVSLKRGWARDPAVPPRLVAAGVPSATPRLPAVPAELARYNSYITVGRLSIATVQLVGGTVDLSILIDAGEYASAWVREVNPVANPPAAGETVPEWVNSRDNALRWLETVVEAASPVIAYLMGIAANRAENNQVTEGPLYTILQSYSLSKLRATPGYLDGYDFANAARTLSIAEARAGRIRAPTLTINV